MTYTFNLTPRFKKKLPVDYLTALSHTNDTIYTGSDDGILSIFSHKSFSSICLQSSTTLTNSSIFSIVTNTTSIITATGESHLFITDKQRAVTTLLHGHNKSIRGVLLKNDHVLYSYSSDGIINCYDLRTKNINHHFTNKKMKSEARCITSLEINKFNDNIIYSGATPGAYFDVWDERYWSNGSIKCDTRVISKMAVEGIMSRDGYVVVLLSDGCLLRLGEMGRFGGVIMKIDRFYCRGSQVLLDEFLNIVIITSGDGVYVVNLNNNTYNLYNVEGFNSVRGIKKNNNEILVYTSDGNLEILELNYNRIADI